MDQTVACIAQLTIPHTPDGFLKPDATREQLGLPPFESWSAWKRPTIY